MPRPRLKSREQLVDSAMTVFWKRGYFATSMEDLVSATGVNRGGIYTDFGGKDALFLASLTAYRERFVTPAIAILLADTDTSEGSDARDDREDNIGLAAIEAYFDHFIALHVRHGMPGPGCFCANVMTELESHQSAIRAVVADHLQELRHGFFTALSAEVREGRPAIATLDATLELEALADFLATTSQGLWSRARTLTDVADLVRFKKTLLALLHSRLETCASACS